MLVVCRRSLKSPEVRTTTPLSMVRIALSPDTHCPRLHAQVGRVEYGDAFQGGAMAIVRLAPQVRVCAYMFVFALLCFVCRARGLVRERLFSNASTDGSVAPPIGSFSRRVALTSPRFSLTRKPSSSAARARLCCASRPVVRLDSPRVAASVARAIKLYTRRARPRGERASSSLVLVR